MLDRHNTSKAKTDAEATLDEPEDFQSELMRLDALAHAATLLVAEPDQQSRERTYQLVMLTAETVEALLNAWSDRMNDLSASSSTTAAAPRRPPSRRRRSRAQRA